MPNIMAKGMENTVSKFVLSDRGSVLARQPKWRAGLLGFAIAATLGLGFQASAQEVTLNFEGIVDSSFVSGIPVVLPSGVEEGDPVEIEIRYDVGNATEFVEGPNETSYFFPRSGTDLIATLDFGTTTSAVDFPNKSIRVINDSFDPATGITQDAIFISMRGDRPDALFNFPGYNIVIKSNSEPNQPLAVELVSSTSLPTDISSIDFSNFDAESARMGISSLGQGYGIRLGRFEGSSGGEVVRSVYYVNGILTDPMQAMVDAAVIKQRYVEGTVVGPYVFDLHYNPTAGPLGDVVETIVQIEGLSERDAFRIAVAGLPPEGDISAEQFDRARQVFVAGWKGTMEEKERIAISQFAIPDELLAHINDYRAVADNALSRNLIISYSQGNLYTSISEPFLSDEVKERTDIVSIATPAPSVFGDTCGEHVTTLEDEVIEAVLLGAIIGLDAPCAPTLINGGVYVAPDGTASNGHGLLSDYLNSDFPSEGILRDKIRLAVEAWPSLP